MGVWRAEVLDLAALVAESLLELGECHGAFALEDIVALDARVSGAWRMRRVTEGTNPVSAHLFGGAVDAPHVDHLLAGLLIAVCHGESAGVGVQRRERRERRSGWGARNKVPGINGCALKENRRSRGRSLAWRADGR